MAIVEIPLRTDLPSFKFSIELDAVVFVLRFNWNTRNQRWFFDIMTQDEVPILMGQPVFVSYGVLKRFQGPLLPKGLIFFYDTNGGAVDPGRVDLGNRVQMFYEEAA